MNNSNSTFLVRPCVSRKAHLWNRLLSVAESNQSNSDSGAQVDNDITFAPRNIGDAHLRRSFEDALINEGLTVSANFALRIASLGRCHTSSEAKCGRSVSRSSSLKISRTQPNSKVVTVTNAIASQNVEISSASQSTSSELQVNHPPSPGPFCFKQKSPQKGKTSPIEIRLSASERVRSDENLAKVHGLPGYYYVIPSPVRKCCRSAKSTHVSPNFSPTLVDSSKLTACVKRRSDVSGQRIKMRRKRKRSHDVNVSKETCPMSPSRRPGKPSTVESETLPVSGFTSEEAAADCRQEKRHCGAEANTISHSQKPIVGANTNGMTVASLHICKNGFENTRGRSSSVTPK